MNDVYALVLFTGIRVLRFDSLIFKLLRIFQSKFEIFRSVDIKKNTRYCKRMVRIRRSFHCRLEKQYIFFECLLSGFKLSGSYSGCRDGSTEGFADHKDVHACKGKWEGHVKKGRSLCQRGWRVCSPRDQASLRYISWIDIFDLQGCYAYNAENTRGKCKR